MIDNDEMDRRASELCVCGHEIGDHAYGTNLCAHCMCDAIPRRETPKMNMREAAKLPAPQQGQTEPHWSDKLTIGFDIYDDEPEYKPQTEPQGGESEPDTFDAIDRAMEIEMLQPRCPNCNAPIGPPAKPQDEPKRPI